MARVLLFGAGATGARIARQLRSSRVVDTLEIRDPSLERRDRLVDDLGDGAVAGRGRRISDDPAVGRGSDWFSEVNLQNLVIASENMINAGYAVH